ncbi:hypothetical protein BpHYR1_038151 [Brachionus plicatilis]|uniref:Uncharacterized protein n=1 Tax=Brachionus plicatilis TaxID=10195 RepID=A0A3M7QA95_BRAPC|nr:hypothetical protein BpHYR1_038151 [Brachionus plicatilis]
MYPHMYTHVYIHMYPHLYPHMHTHVYIHMDPHMYPHLYPHMYPHIYMPKKKGCEVHFNSIVSIQKNLNSFFTIKCYIYYFQFSFSKINISNERCFILMLQRYLEFTKFYI